ncbi:MAG: D-alanine--D-alanine ligase [Desulfovibrionaceae bacterium]|nr:D-alanine--D-alanine ligase [Desulfovibrionaceae bacterium]
MRILLICGGWSTERTISLQGAQGMREALESLGHEVTLFDLLDFDDLLKVAQNYEVALINLHGDPGEDGLVQAMLEQIGVPYQGTSARGSLLALHKAATKQLVHRSGILTPAWEFIPKKPKSSWQPKLPLPLFVKSETGGSSIHLGRVEDLKELGSLCEEIFAAGCGVLLEEAIIGQEVTCGILGEEALPPVLIEPNCGLYFDYQSKYEHDGAREICPAPLPLEVLEHIKSQALKVHKILGLEGLSRSDFIWAKDKLYFLEVNTLPGMTKTSLVPKEAQALGLDFPTLMQRFVDLALSKKDSWKS